MESKRRKQTTQPQNKKTNELTRNSKTVPSSHEVGKRKDEIAVLPRLEVGFYCLFIAVMMYIVMNELHQQSKAYFFNLKRYNFEDGWSILGILKKDSSDKEWKHFISLFNPVNMLGIAGYVVLSHIMQQNLPQHKQWSLFVYSIVCYLVALSLPTLLLICAHVIAMFILAKTQSVYVIWAGVIFQISTLNYTFLMSPILKYFKSDDYYIMVIIVAMASVRSMSFGLEYCKESAQANQKYSFFNYLVYLFYLPTFITGPLMSYEQFYQQYISSPVIHRYSNILKEFFYYIFWAVFLELILHFLYFSAFHNERSVLMSISPMAVGASALCHLYFFQIKYVVIYGLSRTLALVDGVEAPKPPNCIMAMYQYSDMWRYFDRGLHHILMKYIYFPFGGSKHGIIRQLLGAFVCFLYVCYWHGFNRNYCYWAFFNWMGIVFESVVIIVTSTESFNNFMNSLFSRAMQRRLSAFCWTPIYVCLSLSNIVFLAGTRTTYIYFERLILSDFPRNCCFMWLLYYMTIQLIKECHLQFGKKYLCEKNYRIA
ncbi:protein-cysteine N-palmitoyltransferase HHAT-like [Antedon mediterranea]|uniref:protein-cysteine N-palmitoyltransferase HHAT-like n=1 Tax=Antedon mediterranea TaxID=105859 RepID=UPI003AF8AE0E